MTNKQNLIFFLALVLMLISFTISGRTKILWDGIFKGPTIGGNPPTQVRIGKGNKCPPGYNRQPAPGGVGEICVLHSHLPL